MAVSGNRIRYCSLGMRAKCWLGLRSDMTDHQERQKLSQKACPAVHNDPWCLKRSLPDAVVQCLKQPGSR